MRTVRAVRLHCPCYVLPDAVAPPAQSFALATWVCGARFCLRQRSGGGRTCAVRQGLACRVWAERRRAAGGLCTCTCLRGEAAAADRQTEVSGPGIACVAGVGSCACWRCGGGVHAWLLWPCPVARKGSGCVRVPQKTHWKEALVSECLARCFRIVEIALPLGGGGWAVAGGGAAAACVRPCVALRCVALGFCPLRCLHMHASKVRNGSLGARAVACGCVSPTCASRCLPPHPHPLPPKLPCNGQYRSCTVPVGAIQGLATPWHVPELGIHKICGLPLLLG